MADLRAGGTGHQLSHQRVFGRDLRAYARKATGKWSLSVSAWIAADESWRTAAAGQDVADVVPGGQCSPLRTHPAVFRSYRFSRGSPPHRNPTSPAPR
jgi:hypothetical protein